MAIYTKTGDKGTTALFDGRRVKKYADRVEAYGTVDECNSQISVAQKFCQIPRNIELLETIQNNMFIVAGELASEDPDKFYGKSQQVTETDIHLLETVIDEYTNALPVIHEFILPGKSVAGAHLHLARSVCRRAERLVVKINDETTIRPELLKYINRLSDFFYILARAEDDYAQKEQLIDTVIERYRQRIEAE